MEGCIQMAWFMGMIKYDKGRWVDVKTSAPVPDYDVKQKYEERILKNAGIRIIDPELMHRGYDPLKKEFFLDVAISRAMDPFEVADELTAKDFVARFGDRVKCAVRPDGTHTVQLLKGAVISVPRALKFDR